GAEDHAELPFFNGKTHMVGRRDAGVAHLIVFADIIEYNKRHLLLVCAVHGCSTCNFGTFLPYYSRAAGKSPILFLNKRTVTSNFHILLSSSVCRGSAPR